MHIYLSQIYTFIKTNSYLIWILPPQSASLNHVGNFSKLHNWDWELILRLIKLEKTNAIWNSKNLRVEFYKKKWLIFSDKKV
jgi:hypothetical protein